MVSATKRFISEKKILDLYFSSMGLIVYWIIGYRLYLQETFSVWNVNIEIFLDNFRYKSNFLLEKMSNGK